MYLLLQKEIRSRLADTEYISTSLQELSAAKTNSAASDFSRLDRSWSASIPGGPTDHTKFSRKHVASL
jgi:hypothetical protein